MVGLHGNPDERAASNKSKPILQTGIRNNHPMYSTVHFRWRTPRETLTTNTHVVFAHLSQCGETTSFLFDRSAWGFPPRSRRHMFAQAGDGMSLPSVGAALLWYLLPHNLIPGSNEVLNSSPLLAALGTLSLPSSVSESPARRGARPRSPANDCSEETAKRTKDAH